MSARKDERGRLAAVTLRPFKDRSGGAETVNADFTGCGFVSAELAPDRTHDAAAEIDALLRAEGPLSGRAVEQHLLARGLSRQQVRQTLKSGQWSTEKGARGALLYQPHSEAAEPEACNVEGEFECFRL